MYAKADFEDDDTRRMIFEYFIDKIYVFEDKLIVDMFYSDNHVEVSLDAFLASEEYAKESVKDLKINQVSVFDKNAAGSIQFIQIEHYLFGIAMPKNRLYLIYSR